MNNTRKAKIEDLSKFGVNGSLADDIKRQERTPIMEAFDIYKSNVYYGIIAETETEHNTIVTWYRDLCDLKQTAFDNVPNAVKKYIK